MGEPILQVSGIGKSYKNKPVLGGLDLTVKRGEICGLLGPNGSGKTTLLRIITGLVHPDRGEIMLFGRTRTPESLRRTGCIIDRPALYAGRTATENLRLYQTLRGVPEDRSAHLLELVGLDRKQDKKVGRFSAGMKQRLSIAIALVGSPDLLILDEPINGLDTRGIYDMRTLLRSVNEDRGVTILITSHLLDEVSRLATSYAFLRGGAAYKLSAEQVRDRSRQYAEVLTGDREGTAVVLDRFVGSERGYEVLPDGGFRLYEALDCLPRINTALVEAGIPVHSLSLKTQTLADFYLQETGEDGGAHA